MSNVLIYSAMAVYTLAFFAYIAEWIFGSRSKVARTAAALTPKAKKAEGGPAVTVRQGGGTAVLERPKVAVRATAGTRDVPDGPGAHGGDEQGDLYGRIAVSLTVLAFLLALGGVVTRALSVERAPWGNMYEFNITFSTTAVAVLAALGGVVTRALPGERAPWGNMSECNITFSTTAVGVYLALLALKKNVRWIGLFLTAAVLLDLGLAVTVLYTESDQLVP